MLYQGGDKLTLSLGNTSAVSTPASSNLLLDLEPEEPVSSSLELLSQLPPPLTAAPAPGLPVSVTHFSLNGLAGVQRETLFSDVFAGGETSTNLFTTTTSSFNANNPFLNNNINIINNNNNNNNSNDATTSNSTVTGGGSSGSGGGQKFATIGRSNPFTSPNRSKNPFLDRLEGNEVPPPSGTTVGGSSGSPMSTSPATSPEASLDPVSDGGSCTTLNKIVSFYLFIIFILCVCVCVVFLIIRCLAMFCL